MPRDRSKDVVRELARRDVGGDGKLADRTRVDAIADELGPAIANGQLHLVFQPIVDLRTGTCERVEALVRWRHATLGLIDPRDIVRLARRRGLVDALVSWVLRVAAREQQRWAHDGAGTLALSLNLTGDELSGAGPAAMRAALAEAGLDPHTLTFEIPAERALQGGVWDGARRIAASGARLALDDLSSPETLSRAVAMEVDELKISRPLIRRVVADRAAATAARALIEAAHDFGLSSVAVGIEDNVTSEWLARAGCRYGQGYAVSVPLAAAEIAVWRQWAARVTFGSTALVAVSAVPAAVFAPHSVTAPFAARGSATTCCSLQAPAGAHAAGLAMTDVSVGGAHLYVEGSPTGDVLARISAAVARDVPAAQADFGTTFAHAPDVYVFTTRASFALALQSAFGQRASDAAALSVANGGVAFPSESAIVINWSAVTGEKDLGIVRHELTHLLVHQLAGVDAQIPAWLDEGLATRAEHTVAPDAVRDARDASATLSLSRTNAVSLRDLSSAGEWTMANAHLDGRGYAVASEAVGVLEQGLGHDGIRQLLQRAHAVGFAQAFGEATGGSTEDFANAFPARAAAMHGGAWITQQADASSVHWTAAGFTAGAKLHVVIDGGSYHVEFDAAADRDGMYSAVFGGTAPAGTYRVSVSSMGMSATSQLAI